VSSFKSESTYHLFWVPVCRERCTRSGVPQKTASGEAVRQQWVLGLRFGAPVSFGGYASDSGSGLVCAVLYFVGVGGVSFFFPVYLLFAILALFLIFGSQFFSIVLTTIYVCLCLITPFAPFSF